MRIIRFEDEQGQVRYGLDKDVVRDGVAAGRVELLKGDPFSGLGITGERAGLVRLLAPVVPTNIFCIGRNYVDHIKEFDRDIPEYPILFLKNTASLNDPGAPIRIPKCQMKGPEVDFEGELAVVIGKPARDVSEGEALNYVLGYTVSNDVSARRWQIQGGGGQWCRGKGFDTFCPLGPSLLTADELGDPQNLLYPDPSQRRSDAGQQHLAHDSRRCKPDCLFEPGYHPAARHRYPDRYAFRRRFRPGPTNFLKGRGCH